VDEAPSVRPYVAAAHSPVILSGRRLGGEGSQNAKHVSFARYLEQKKVQRILRSFARRPPPAQDDGNYGFSDARTLAAAAGAIDRTYATFPSANGALAS
jgi:hypothetical protein